ncbi:MAG: hypothetical protein KJ650_06560 [Firmicutes bacterium]|nr:hypothetical protein [Bacillota bacterium]MBV1726852.1 hypothetical protein [Desulforudis sp.]MBV1736025.1 hypothetical protein [Desulforudis sp.]
MDEERRRIAREIHDGPAQSMANLILQSEFCSRMLDRDPENIPDEPAMLQGLVRACLRDVRKIIPVCH